MIQSSNGNQGVEKMKKYTVAALMALFLMLAILTPLPAQTGSDFTTRRDGNGIIITRYRGNGEAVTIPAAIGGKPVISIGERAFSRNNRLKSVTVPPGVAGIGKDAFSNCKSLVSIVIPASVTSIIAGAFSGCSSLESINVSPENRQYKDIDGVLFTKDGETLLVYPIGGKTAYAIPEGVTAIGRDAFSGCENLVSVIIPAGVTSIGGWAFYACSSLTSITIPASLISIEDSAFLKCKSLPPGARADIENRFGSGVSADPQMPW
jgi:hypothetical protein